MDLINPFVDKTLSQREVNDKTPDASLNPQVRLQILSLCLNGAKDFFQSFLTIPASEYRSMSMVQWNALIFATMVLYKLSIGMASIPEWNPEVARTSVPLETYLEICCQRMSAATSQRIPDGWEQGQDLFSMMGPIWKNVKDTYLRLRQMSWNEAIADLGKVHATSFPEMSASGQRFPSHTTVRHRCPAFSFWASKQSRS